MGKKQITLEIDGDEVRFEVGASDYEAYQDDVTMNKKVVPSKRLLKATVQPEDKATLQGYIDQGLALEIAAALIEEYQGAVKIVVKKSSAA